MDGTQGPSSEIVRLTVTCLCCDNFGNSFLVARATQILLVYHRARFITMKSNNVSTELYVTGFITEELLLNSSSICL
jgi:hypothetical protein